MRRLMFEEGETIFAEGDPSTLVYRISAGSVDILLDRREGGRRRVAALGPGEIFGEMGIIDPGPRSAKAVAREATVCEAFEADEILSLLEQNPAEAIDLVRTLILRLRSADRKLAAGGDGA